MPLTLKCLTRRSRGDAALPAIYASTPLLFLNSTRSGGPHISVIFEACLLMSAAILLAAYVRRRRCTAA